MQDNAPSYAVHQTMEYLQQLDICEPWKRNCLVNSPDLNPIKNLWGILKQQVYEKGCQFRSKENFWQIIVKLSQNYIRDIQKLICSMD